MRVRYAALLIACASLGSAGASASAAGEPHLSARAVVAGEMLIVMNRDGFQWSHCSFDINFEGPFKPGYRYRYLDIASGEMATIELRDFTRGDGERFDPATHAVTVLGFDCNTPDGRLGWATGL